MAATASTSPTSPASQVRRSRSQGTRDRIVDAALIEFADHGFDGASTRDIAERAGVAQPLIHYHFSGKDDLWRAAVDRCFEDLDRTLEPVFHQDEPVEALRSMVRCFVRFAAATPQLNRIMAQEGAAESARLEWLVETHTRPRYKAFAALLARVDPATVVTTDPELAFHTVVGAASLRYVASAEAVRLSEPSRRGDVGSDAQVEAHADLLERMVLRNPQPGSPPRPRRSST